NLQNHPHGAWPAASRFKRAIGPNRNPVFFINLDDFGFDQVHLGLIVGPFHNGEQPFLRQSHADIIGWNSFECAEVMEYKRPNMQRRLGRGRQRGIPFLRYRNKRRAPQRSTHQRQGKKRTFRREHPSPPIKPLASLYRPHRFVQRYISASFFVVAGFNKDSATSRGLDVQSGNSTTPPEGTSTMYPWLRSSLQLTNISSPAARSLKG